MLLVSLVDVAVAVSLLASSAAAVGLPVASACTLNDIVVRPVFVPLLLSFPFPSFWILSSGIPAGGAASVFPINGGIIIGKDVEGMMQDDV